MIIVWAIMYFYFQLYNKLRWCGGLKDNMDIVFATDTREEL